MSGKRKEEIACDFDKFYKTVLSLQWNLCFVKFKEKLPIRKKYLCEDFFLNTLLSVVHAKVVLNVDGSIAWSYV